MDVQWRDITVDVPGRRILHPCSGSLGPGRMVALIGPSGSGKTTLLSCIRQDRPCRGTIRFDGQPFTPRLRQRIGFVEQEDVVIPEMTVRQSLQFLAELHFGAGDEASSRVGTLLSSLRLEAAADTVIGRQDTAEKISGGQKKRLCIARELISQPRLLLCDESTSGLDSTMAEQVIESMRQLCDARSVSVMASIHQPSTSIFEQFDDVVLLKDGEVVFMGPLSEVEAVLTAHGPPRAPLQSVAEYIMDCLVLDHEPPLRVAELAARSRENAAALPAIEAAIAAPATEMPQWSRTSGVQVDDGQLRLQIPFLRQLRVLYRRHVRLVCRATFTKRNLFLNVGLASLAGLLWWQLNLDIRTIESRHSIICWTAGTWMFLPMMGSLGTFSAEGDAVKKELKAGNYALRSYYLAKTLLMIPVELVWPTLWLTSVFWMTNLSPSFSVYVCLLCSVYMTYMLFEAAGLMIAASGMPMSSAGTLAVLLIFYFFGWTPLLMDLRRIPTWLHWAKDANIFNKAVEMMFSVVVEELEFTCKSAPGAATAQLGCDDGVVTGEEARQRMGISIAPGTCAWILVACCVVFRIVAFCLLRRSYREAIDGASVGASDASEAGPPVLPAEAKAKREDTRCAGEDQRASQESDGAILMSVGQAPSAMDVQWRDVTVDVPKKRILHPCSGSLGPGRMVALMGPSGSGKTTLLSCFRQDRHYAGTILFDGKPFTAKLRQSIGFVEQEDVVLDAMTVRHALQFLAELQSGTASAQAVSRVSTLLGQLRLENVADVKIKDISGGQRKRLCIARELFSDPRLFLCDEPTTGLDSTMAEQVAVSMRRLCDARSVSLMASIHQPSTCIFQNFDEMILLSQGSVVYSGPTSEVERLFTSYGPPRKPLQSVAEYVMDCIQLDLEPPLRVSELTALALKQAAALPALEVAQAESWTQAIRRSFRGDKDDEGHLRHRVPFLRQLSVLFRRHVRLVCGAVFTKQNVCLNMGIMFLASFLWLRLGSQIEDIEPRFACVCWCIGTWMFIPIFGVLGVFAADSGMVKKELKAGQYTLRSYYLARTLMMLPLDLVFPTFWFLGVFGMTNLNPSFLVYLQLQVLIWLTFALFESVGHIIAATGMPQDAAATLANLCITFFFGYTQLLNDMSLLPPWLRWAPRGNIFKYAIEMVFSIAVKDMEFTCGPSTNLAQARLGCDDGVVSREETRERLAISSEPATCLWILVACCVAFRILAFFILRFAWREAIDGAGSKATSGQVADAEAHAASPSVPCIPEDKLNTMAAKRPDATIVSI